MRALTLSFLLCLASVAASAFPGDIVEAIDQRLAGQNDGTAVDRRLARFLDQDDILGASAFVEQLWASGEIDGEEKRALDEQIWRIKTERTLEYARNIREAIEDSDLERMRSYNARLQRLTAATRAEPEAAAADDAVEAKTAEVIAEPKEGAPAGSDDVEQAPGEDRQNAIDELVRRGEAAVAALDLTIAPAGAESALDMVDALLALGDAGRPAATALGRKVTATYQRLIERHLQGGRLDKAGVLAERMLRAAERAGISRSEAEGIVQRVEQAKADLEEHERLLRLAGIYVDQGKLIAPAGDNALALAVEAMTLGKDPLAAERVVDSIVIAQRAQAERLAESGRYRDAARALDALASSLLAADIGRSALAANLRAEAGVLLARAEQEDRERARLSTAATQPVETAVPEDSNDRDAEPFTFVTPF